MNFFTILASAPVMPVKAVMASPITPNEALVNYQLRELHVIALASIVLFLLLVLAAVLPNHSPLIKRILYWPMVIIVIAATLVSIVVTTEFNGRAWSKGPVHWQADYEVWVCGKRVTLKAFPEALMRRLGTSFRISHSNTRIDYDSAVTVLNDATLGQFIASIGGELSNDSIDIPTTSGSIHYTNGDPCRSGIPGEVQVFGYKIDSDESYVQSKLFNAPTYTISPQAFVPPGDCIIIEFDEPKDKTDHLCASYQRAQENGVTNEEDSNDE